MPRTPGTLRASAAAAVLAVFASACSPSSSEPAENQLDEFFPPQGSLQLPDAAPPGVPPRCAPGGGRTVEPGILTIATDDPAYEPWFTENDPANGQGFEGAVARAVAEGLGYAPDLTSFVRVAFNEALEAGPKDFDFAISQFSILGQRRENVDFSAPYYAVAQAVVTLEDNAAAGATALADLEELQLGAHEGSTALYAAAHSIHPQDEPRVYPTTEGAIEALENGEIDALIADLPTAVQIADERLSPNGVVVGRFPAPNEVTEFFGLVLEKGSAFTECATIALENLHHEGVLENLADEWLSGQDEVRVLR
ncbi:ABC transporter substrate-binding protein [Hoyosella subflava]|uniref:Putative ABC transporter substrate-binding protein n=1 Tax=Hoyosella subflava (strain DSM 45089 / JCM 17490 / NBRC 109087 / DQS3-9A1) TaxID=443218 RepID=F6ES44_HOYSD|nr:ABC transporter substrate-binding protein [Hoyosella subflava]AEF42048.1 Putative ABC transporter substrate-binding protein [Hoyosella subflava DQS3-9A1]